MHSGKEGQQVGVTQYAGNVYSQTIYDRILNIGRKQLTAGQLYRLPDIPAAWVRIHASSDNDENVWMGGIETQVPAVNVGMPIEPGKFKEFHTTNTNLISLLSEVNGEEVYIVVGAVGQMIPSTPDDPPPYDKVPPTIVSSTPDPLLGRPIDSPISILADKALLPASVNNTNITIVPALPLGGMVTLDSGNPALILILYTGYLADWTMYTVTVSGIQNLNGYTMAGPPYSYSFTTSDTTAPPDPTPPTLVSSDPLANATDVTIDTVPTVTFSQAMLPITINDVNIVVVNVDTVTNMEGTSFSLSADEKTVSINDLTLEEGVNYRIDLYNTPVTGLKNKVGVTLDATYSIPFKTRMPSVLEYNVSGEGGTYSSLQSSSAYTYSGEYLYSASSSLIGKIPVKYTFILRKNGSPAGNFTVVWKRQSGGSWTDYKTLLTQAASTIGTGDTTVTVEDTGNNDAFQRYDAIGIKYTAGTSSNYLRMKTAPQGDAYNGTNTCLRRILYNGSYDLRTDYDNAGTIYVRA